MGGEWSRCRGCSGGSGVAVVVWGCFEGMKGGVEGAVDMLNVQYMPYKVIYG